jgi:hypothetical protein
MKIAISGTHNCGKSTLIDQFLRSHPEFEHEAEPYVVLQEEYGEEFSAEPTDDEFFRQLEFNISRLEAYSANDLVIYERCPADFLAYLLALSDLGRCRYSGELIERSSGIVEDAIRLLDLILFLRADDVDDLRVPDSEDNELRKAVDARLQEILIDDDLGYFAAGRPRVIEATGSTERRLILIETTLKITDRPVVCKDIQRPGADV